MEIGCLRLCGARNDACNQQCEIAIKRYPEYYRSDNTSYALTAFPIARIENDIDITGGDIFTYTSSGFQIITSRDGRVFRFLPNPKPTQSVLTEIYRIPDELRLDTASNKGLYDVTFPRNFKSNSLMYLLFAVRSTNPAFDHINVVGEFKLDYMKLEVEFVQIVHQMPQVSNTRSGGTLKVGKALSDTDYSPLWVTSSGNLSIYGIFPEAIKSANKDYSAIHGKSARVWATGLNNPTECDYAPQRDSTQFYCLDERYDAQGLREYVVVQGVTNTLTTGVIDVQEVSRSTTTTTSTVESNERKVLDRKIYAPVYEMFSRTQCMPDSLVYSFDNLLSAEYRTRVIIAIPSCEAERFRPPRLAMLVKSSRNKVSSFMDMPVDLGEELLVDFRLMGTERSRGLFFIATQISTGYRDIYQVKDTDMYSAESGTLASFSSYWTTTVT